MSTIPSFSTTTWAEEIAKADAHDAMETAGNPFPLDTKPIAYRWSNGRTFKEGDGPYTSV